MTLPSGYLNKRDNATFLQSNTTPAEDDTSSKNDEVALYPFPIATCKLGVFGARSRISSSSSRPCGLILSSSSLVVVCSFYSAMTFTRKRIIACCFFSSSYSHSSGHMTLYFLIWFLDVYLERVLSPAWRSVARRGVALFFVSSLEP